MQTPSARASRLRPLAAALVCLFTAAAAHAQPAPAAPAREELLNGLKVLLVEQPGQPQAALRLRVHSGAAFDLAGKEGLMALLGDALFPDAQTRDYVTGDLEGRLEVSVGYDSIDVLLTGRAGQIERLVELVRNAVVNTQLSPEVFTRLRDARLKIVQGLEVSPEAAADRAASARLYGPFPYGRRVTGTAESVQKIERSDLMLIRERFLNPNNATLIISGGFDRRRTMRAVRQFLGAWRKSDSVVPATFRRPEPPDARTLVVDLPAAPDAEVRLVARGPARAETDLPAALVLAEVARTRWLAAAPELKGRAVSVRHDSHALSGTFVMRASAPTPAAAAQALESARKVLGSIAQAAPTTEEVDAARRSVLATLNKARLSEEGLWDAWLDEQTYGSDAATPEKIYAAVNTLSPAAVQRVASNILGGGAAMVAVGDANRLRAELARLGEVEVLGEKTAQEAPKAAPAGPLKAPGPRRP